MRRVNTHENASRACKRMTDVQRVQRPPWQRLDPLGLFPTSRTYSSECNTEFSTVDLFNLLDKLIGTNIAGIALRTCIALNICCQAHVSTTVNCGRISAGDVEVIRPHE